MDYLVALALLAVPVGLIVKQPDLGTAILVLSAGLYVIFFAGLSWKLILPVALLGAGLVMVWSASSGLARTAPTAPPCSSVGSGDSVERTVEEARVDGDAVEVHPPLHHGRGAHARVAREAHGGARVQGLPHGHVDA